ncbi:helix-turn-helix domain-containing protein [Georgenia yuyongxinii]|uniref:Helix-turn-helix domain-containing protein n=1 Tax=Georgenia yuyongxinii TaxID=2589797 RepID=A0A552WUX1_9MICO|nr:helix-turn-helix domain-containing protein [Georgenia yuyongxinii]TRW46359.1 helix-turn-helix domain-containing protein [Georgenia yuyongxinii]
MSKAESAASGAAGNGGDGKVTTLDEAITSTRAILNLGEVAAVLGAHRRSVSRGVADGTIPSIRLGRRVLIPRLSFLAMLGASTNDTTTAEESAA